MPKLILPGGHGEPTLRNPDDPEYYRTTAWNRRYSPPYNKGSGISCRVLLELTGTPWNENALAAVHGLRPSAIRVTTGEVTTGICPYGVTVLVNEDNLILSIMQDLVCGIPPGVTHGADLIERIEASRQPLEGPDGIDHDEAAD